MTSTPDTIKDLAKQHMLCLCAVLTQDPQTRAELATSLNLIFELGRTAGGIEQAHRSLKMLSEPETN